MIAAVAMEGNERNRTKMSSFLTFLVLGLFRDVLFPGRERSNVNFKPSPVKKKKARSSVLQQQLIKVHESNLHIVYFHML